MSTESNKKVTILAVDDEPEILFLMSKIFQSMGYGVLTAQTGDSALKYFAACGDNIDVLLIDLHLPDKDGLEVIKAVRGRYPALSVIVMSGQSERKAECEKAGIQTYLKKPYSLDDLCRSVAILIEKREQPIVEEVTLSPQMILSAKILVVDDEVEVGQIIGETLTEDFPECNFKVRYASSGEEALRISKEFRPDIGIIDIKMPGMLGEELIDRMKSGEGYCPRDFVIYTGVTEPQMMERARNLGHHVVTKPTNIQALFEVLKRICVRHHLVQKREA